LRYSEECCRLAPEKGAYLNTLGVAYYRLANDKKAIETLMRADRLNQKLAEYLGSIPADLAFLAMAQQRLGHVQEAHAHLKQLRERMKDPRWANSAEANAFLREAEMLLEGKKADSK
jgi:tetratricopeptide (TPR) repeat protein